ncbi:hypothetical protein MASR2M54_23670 [Aliarcobacter cryaerophilus]
MLKMVNIIVLTGNIRLIITHIFIGKVNVGLTITDAGFLYGTFACVLGDNETNKYSQKHNTIAPVRTCTGDNCYNNQINLTQIILKSIKMQLVELVAVLVELVAVLTLAEIEPKFAEIITRFTNCKK